MTQPPAARHLRLFTDGAARGNPGPAGLGVVIEDADGMRLQGQCRYIGETTNNQAEYFALIQGLETALAWQPERLDVYLDSKLVAEQLAGAYRVKHKLLEPLHRRAKELLARFPQVSVGHVERERNRGADALANKAIDDWQAAHGRATKRRR